MKKKLFKNLCKILIRKAPKVNQSSTWNDWMRSLFLTKCQPKITRISALSFYKLQGRNPGNNLLAFWEKRWPHKFTLNLTDLPIGILQIVSEILMQSAQTDGLRILQEFDFGDDKNSDRKSRWLMRVMELPDHLVEIKYWLWMYSLQRYIITLEPFGA